MYVCPPPKKNLGGDIKQILVEAELKLLPRETGKLNNVVKI